jgi:uncharacterized protein
VRVILDPNVLVSAVVTPGVSADLLDRWLTDRPFQLVVCPILIAELRGVLARPKFRRWITTEEATAFVDLLEREAEPWVDPVEVPPATGDPKDDYLVAVHRSCQADLLVSGDSDLLDWQPTTSPSSPQARCSIVSSCDLARARLTIELAVRTSCQRSSPQSKTGGYRGWGVEDSNLWPLACRARRNRPRASTTSQGNRA